MDIDAIEKLVSIIRNARISELTVSSAGSTIRLRKSLMATSPANPVASRLEAQPQLYEPVSGEETAPAEVYITAPMVGMFHSIDSVTVGSEVHAGQVVGAIESMKLMNDVVSQLEGVISDVLIEDGSPVEYGQNLFRLDQSSNYRE